MAAKPELVELVTIAHDLVHAASTVLDTANANDEALQAEWLEDTEELLDKNLKEIRKFRRGK